MDDMINRHDSIAEENIEPNGRPAKNQFEESTFCPTLPKALGTNARASWV